MNQIRTIRGHYGGGFGGYQVPNSNEFGALSQINELTLAASDAVTLFNLSGTNLGFLLNNVDTGYFSLLWYSGAIFVTGGDVAGRQSNDLREGATASSAAGGGNLITNGATPHSTVTGPITNIGGFFAGNRPSAGVNSEFGYHAHDSSTTITRSRVHGATLLVLPLTSTLFNGSTLGKQSSSWALPNPGTITIGAPGADTDVSVSASFTVGKDGTYLCFFRNRVGTGNAGAARALRWSNQIDGIDVHSVRTNTLTGGAIRTGRGFQMQYPIIANVNQYLMSAQVVSLTAGNHTYTAVGNRHEAADNVETIGNNLMFAVNTGMFRQFKYVQVSTAQTALTSAAWAAHQAFQQTITIDGTAKLLLILNTSSHQNTSSGALSIRIKRNGSVITPADADAGAQNYPAFGGYAVVNGTNGAADSDNDTIPYCLIWVDNPGAGTWTYTIESADQGSTSNALWNANDNGASGFKGLFAIAELAFARSGF